MKHVVVGIISKEVSGVEKYLLVSSVLDYGKYSGFYYPPGGHIEKGENIRNVLIEKIKKELNIEIKPIKEIAKTPSDVKNQTTHWWICDAEIVELSVNKKRLKDALWFTREQISQGNNIWPATKHFFDKYIFNKTEMPLTDNFFES